MDAFKVVRDFEAAIGEYTGAPYVVTVNSCTQALYLALLWEAKATTWVEMPKRTYPSVPMAAKRAGLKVRFNNLEWEGGYQIYPSRVWDYAKRFTAAMYIHDQFQCVSFHPQKPLGLSNGGGAILHDSSLADKWFRKMRFDGRTEGVPTKDDSYKLIGEHCYMMPPTAAEGLQRLSIYSRVRYHEDFPSELELYPDCSQYEVFR